MVDDLRFEQVTREELDGNDERAMNLARLVWSAGDGYYSLISSSPDLLLPLIALQIAMPGTELSDTIVMRAELDDVGLIASTDFGTLGAAQLASLSQFMRHIRGDDRARLVEALKRYSATVEPAKGKGRYISRVAVYAHCRGLGYGGQMIRWFIDSHGTAPIGLHVHRDNVAAIALYRSLGFARISDRDFDYPAFVRDAGSLQ